MITTAIAYTDPSQAESAQMLAKQLGMTLTTIDDDTYQSLLVFTATHLELRLTTANAPGAVYVDFVKGAVAHRHQYGGGRGQLIARAVGLQRYQQPTVLDVTAGLGRDAFVLATLGCDVVMLERSKIIAALLADGLQRAQMFAWFQQLALQLMTSDARDYLTSIHEKPDVIYIDPMFPDTKKTALVKKEMRVLRAVVGDDIDAPELLALALPHAKRRVVVKRARLSPCLAGPKPDLQFKGKSSRYDVYLTKQQ